MFQQLNHEITKIAIINYLINHTNMDDNRNRVIVTKTPTNNCLIR